MHSNQLLLVNYHKF